MLQQYYQLMNQRQATGLYRVHRFDIPQSHIHPAIRRLSAGSTSLASSFVSQCTRGRSRKGTSTTRTCTFASRPSSAERSLHYPSVLHGIPMTPPPRSKLLPPTPKTTWGVFFWYWNWWYWAFHELKLRISNHIANRPTVQFKTLYSSSSN